MIKKNAFQASGSSPSGVQLPQNTAGLKETDSLTIAEFAYLFGFMPSAVITAIERNRGAIKKPFYTISEVAERWGCSRATVYNVLRESEAKLLNISSKDSEKKSRWSIPASVVERIEQRRMERLPEVAT